MFSDCEKCTHCSRWYRAFESYCEYIEEMVLSDPNDPDYEEYTKNEKLINKAEENNAPCPLFNLKVLEQNPKLKSDIKSVSKNLIKNLTENQAEDIISGEWEPNYIKQEINKIMSEIEEETYNVVIDELIKANYQ